MSKAGPYDPNGSYPLLRLTFLNPVSATTMARISANIRPVPAGRERLSLLSWLEGGSTTNPQAGVYVRLCVRNPGNCAIHTWNTTASKAYRPYYGNDNDALNPLSSLYKFRITAPNDTIAKVDVSGPNVRVTTHSPLAADVGMPCWVKTSSWYSGTVVAPGNPLTCSFADPASVKAAVLAEWNISDGVSPRLFIIEPGFIFAELVGGRTERRRANTLTAEGRITYFGAHATHEEVTATRGGSVLFKATVSGSVLQDVSPGSIADYLAPVNAYAAWLATGGDSVPLPVELHFGPFSYASNVTKDMFRTWKTDAEGAAALRVKGKSMYGFKAGEDPDCLQRIVLTAGPRGRTLGGKNLIHSWFGHLGMAARQCRISTDLSGLRTSLVQTVEAAGETSSVLNEGCKSLLYKFSLTKAQWPGVHIPDFSSIAEHPADVHLRRRDDSSDARLTRNDTMLASTSDTYSTGTLSEGLCPQNGIVCADAPNRPTQQECASCSQYIVRVAGPLTGWPNSPQAGGRSYRCILSVADEDDPEYGVPYSFAYSGTVESNGTYLQETQLTLRSLGTAQTPYFPPNSVIQYAGADPVKDVNGANASLVWAFTIPPAVVGTGLLTVIGAYRGWFGRGVQQWITQRWSPSTSDAFGGTMIDQMAHPGIPQAEMVNTAELNPVVAAPIDLPGGLNARYGYTGGFARQSILRLQTSDTGTVVGLDEPPTGALPIPTPAPPAVNAEPMTLPPVPGDGRGRPMRGAARAPEGQAASCTLSAGLSLTALGLRGGICQVPTEADGLGDAIDTDTLSSLAGEYGEMLGFTVENGLTMGFLIAGMSVVTFITDLSLTRGDLGASLKNTLEMTIVGVETGVLGYLTLTPLLAAISPIAGPIVAVGALIVSLIIMIVHIHDNTCEAQERL